MYTAIFIDRPAKPLWIDSEVTQTAIKMILRLLVVGALFVGTARGSVKASERCVQRTLTADMLPGPDRWHELPNATYEVSLYRYHLLKAL